ncbi:Zn-dependent peptidase ImmA, M78 family [Amycolatopsis xylanica]|uniref:Zn-dependent peptidase ImmA, M78 family n=1 Tax=Amycolatopsis xylanica TaxID=589385 RepID=A0A1H3SU07_9PSEU|nr:XRE family transcriptional regulator [Amycolatopsis xylanica]SDZ41476.1 Zn-dependent peptidase ImmA, M78 family [Amycolatopsis xylanica]
MVTPERITLARKRRSLTVAELARRLDVSAQSVTNYERGRQQPSTGTLRRLALVLGFPEAFFMAPPGEEVPETAVAFRARSKLSLGKRASAVSAGVLAVEFNTWLEETFRLPEPDLPTLDHPDPETAAEMTRARWGLGNEPIPNVIHLLEAHGVRVFSLATEHSEVDAFSFWQASTPFVFLNTGKTPERSRFDAAHELGHLVMHAGARESRGPEAEQQANAFAGAFLMPESSVRARMPQAPLIDQILEGKQIWRVSALALTYRLHELDMLSDWQYRSACVELSRLGYRKGEPEGIPGETSQLLTKVFAALRENGKSVHDVAAELRLGSHDLSGMMFGLVVAAVSTRHQPQPSPPGRPRLTVV